MGIFNNKQDADAVSQDGTSSIASESTQSTGAVNASTSPQTESGNTQTAPTLDSPAQDNTTGGYIMTDTPTNLANPAPTAPPQEIPVVDSTASPVSGIPEETAPELEQISPAYPVDPIETAEPEAPKEESVPLDSSPDVPSIHPIDMTETNSQSTTAETTNDLSDIKDQALKQLSPLVQFLDQSPEEKFHTTMMMIQSTDDPTLVKTAYEAAQEITDDKTKAQALLDIVNEINYFNQQKND